MAVTPLEKAYPGVSFRWRSRNWWARLTRVPPECVHLEREFSWMATYVPDTLYLQGKAAVQRHPARPEVSLCRECLQGQLENELAGYRGRVLAFEPGGSALSQYFFVAAPDFAAAGLKPDVAAAIEKRVQEPLGTCQGCDEQARWLWIPRVQVESLDEASSIATVKGLALCPRHGAQQLCEAFGAMSEANLLYMNAPYGDAGAYLWI